MGFVYNNVSEAMCKTYLEMNGWFVQTNLFTDLLTAPKGQELYRLEADQVAVKIPGTKILGPDDKQVAVDDVSLLKEEGEFLAGLDNKDDHLVYCELKANFSDSDPLGVVEPLLTSNGVKAIAAKQKMIQNRFQRPVQVVVMAYCLTETPEWLAKKRKATLTIKQKIRKNGWLFKEFGAIRRFMFHRFNTMPDAKKRIAYSDPWLDFVRFLMVEGLTQGGQ